MATSNQENQNQLLLKGVFEGVTLQKSETSGLTIDLSALKGVDVTILTDGTIKLKAPAREQTNEPCVINGAVDQRAYNIGDVLPDGWIVGPVSPDTGIVMAIEPVAGALDGYQTWHKGENHAAELRRKGHANARQPSDVELNAIYNGVVQAGRNDNARFDTSDTIPYGQYWTSKQKPNAQKEALVQYLKAGGTHWCHTNEALARVRCVRDQIKLSGLK